MGETKTGNRCKAPALKDDAFCSAHSTLLPVTARFGSSEQAREAATGVERRYPRLREVVAQRIEESAERIIEAQLEGLDATRAVVVGEGENAYVEHHPDFLTRLRAGDTLTSRALGKPTTNVNANVESKALTVTFDASDPNARELLGKLLRARPAA